MTVCALVHENGVLEAIECQQCESHLVLGGPVSFVGVIPEAQVVILALEHPQPEHASHSWSGRWPIYEKEQVFGKLFLAATDEHGGEVDLDVAHVKRCLAESS
jgi:hypothetical protein